MTFWRTLEDWWKRNTENWIKIALLLILVLAAFLRFYRLDAQSLWADEGNSVSLSGRSLDLITAGAAHDIHPPLYYYLLHFWMRVFGNSEFSVRALSALLGTTLVYLTYLLGRRLSRPPSIPPQPWGGGYFPIKEDSDTMQKEVVIIDAVRSPVGRHNGVLSSVRPDDLLAKVLKALMERTGVDPALVEDVYSGCGNQAGEDNRDVARMSLLLAGFPMEVSGITVNRNCSSALDAVNLAAKSIIVGEADIFIGAGVECMSRAPWSMPKPERPQPVGHPKIWDTTIGWRYNNPKLDALYPIISLGETAENIADEMGISREEQDAFALESHRRAVEAIKAGKFKDEIVPIEVPQRKGPPKIVDTDEHPRYKIVDGEYVLATSMELLARLRPVFRKGGTVTAGNSSGINDGAAALLLMSADKASELGAEADGTLGRLGRGGRGPWRDGLWGRCRPPRNSSNGWALLWTTSASSN